MCHVSCHEDAGEFIDLCAPVLRSSLKLLREIHTRDLRKDLHSALADSLFSLQCLFVATKNLAAARNENNHFRSPFY
jgi:hypothetical protein